MPSRPSGSPGTMSSRQSGRVRSNGISERRAHHLRKSLSSVSGRSAGARTTCWVMSNLGASIHAGVPWPWRVGRKVRSSIGALGNRASTNERMRARATAPSGPVNGIPSMTPMSAMFIGAVAVSAQSAHKSGTGTRTIDAGSVASVWGTFEALCSTRVFTLRRSWSKVRCIHQPNAGVSRRRKPRGRSLVRRNTSQRPEMSWICPSVWASRARDRLIAVHERGRSILVSSINASPTPRPNVTRNVVPAATGSGVTICARSIWGFHRGSFLTCTMRSKISLAGAAMSIAFSTAATSNRPASCPFTTRPGPQQS
jgi:hypothetical protein